MVNRSQVPAQLVGESGSGKVPTSCELFLGSRLQKPSEKSGYATRALATRFGGLNWMV